MAKKIGDTRLREFALVGARAKLAALEGEIADLLGTFPELRRGRGASKAPASTAGRKRGRKQPMSAAERRAVSERMRKYWADRRAKR